jgi:hypothetical protein
MGSFVAAGVYKLFKVLGYETANPGQDGGKEGIAILYTDEESALAANDLRGEGHELGYFHRQGKLILSLLFIADQGWLKDGTVR